MRSVRRQMPFLILQPEAIASRCVRAMADSLLYGTTMAVRRGWRGFLQQIFHFSR